MRGDGARSVSVPAMVGRALPEAGPPVVPKALARALSADEGSVDVWASLARVLDLSELRPALADDIELRIFRLRWGNDYAMIANPRRLIHFQLEVWEAELAQKMDGTRTVAEIVVDHLEGTGDLDASAVTDFVTFLMREGFLDPKWINVPAHLADALRPKPSISDRILTFAKTLSLEWSDADRHVRWWYRTLLRPLFSRTGAFVTVVLAVVGFAAFLVVQASGRHSIGEANAPLDSVIILALGFVLTYSHELGHALALVHFGRRIRNAGFMLYFGSPAFFVDASDGLMLERGPRILESAMGPFAEMILAGCGAILLLAFPDARFAPLLYKFTALNYFVIFENLIPLLELDGYFILAEADRGPRPSRALAAVHTARPLAQDPGARTTHRSKSSAWARTRSRGSPSRSSSVWVAIFFWEAIFGNLVSALWNGGTGSRLLLLLLAAFVTGPLVRGLITLVRAAIERLRALARSVRFRFETSWRVEAAQMIDALPAFDELPEDVLSDLAGRIRLVAVRPGQPIFRQGDRADAFYVVRTGTLQVEEEHPDTGTRLSCER